mgnify:CR=1 FL=1
MKPYRKENIPRAKELRKNMTPWERKLWYEFLRNYPLRFQRQKAVGDYIADFYCAKAGLVVELDGGGHYEALRESRSLSAFGPRSPPGPAYLLPYTYTSLLYLTALPIIGAFFSYIPSSSLLCRY